MKSSNVVGVRELKSGLSAYLRRVRQGQSLVITDRGEPVAEIRPIKPRTEIDAILLRLEAEGRVTLPKLSRHPRFRPIRLRGSVLASALIIEDREDRF